MNIMRKEKAKVLWRKILGDPHDCSYCSQTTTPEFPENARFCFYFIEHPDGEAHPMCCLEIYEHFKRRKQKGGSVCLT